MLKTTCNVAELLKKVLIYKSPNTNYYNERVRIRFIMQHRLLLSWKNYTSLLWAIFWLYWLICWWLKLHVTSFITLDGHLVADKKSISGSISGLQFWPIFGFKPNLIFVSWIIQCRDVGSKHPLHIMLTTLQEQPPSPSKQMNFGLVSFFLFSHPNNISSVIMVIDSSMLCWGNAFISQFSELYHPKPLAKLQLGIYL